MTKLKIENVTIGSDPELFLFSEIKNRHITAIGLVGGTKDNPTPITENGHFIQEDGVAMEFNIPPCKSKEELVKNINFVKNYLLDTVAKPNNCILSDKASAWFTDEQLDHQQAQEIGCCPDLNSWDLMMNYPQGYENNMRACGGHIHVGYDNSNDLISIELSKAMDLFLAVPSVLLDNDIDRRKLYGKAGAMRFKPFGLEMRTLSNFWIFNDELIEWVYDNTLKAIEFVNIGGIITNPEDIIRCINTCDKDLAREIIDDYKINIPSFEERLMYEPA